MVREGYTNRRWQLLKQALTKHMIENLFIITTGGTIDKIYFDDKSDYQIGEPQIGATLRAFHVGFDFRVNALMRKDSLHLTDEDRQLIRESVIASEASHILITHGTDTMVETALALQDIPGKTIVLTGSLSPARFRDSDAVFNIGCAVGAAQALSEGTWIVMNGRAWKPDEVRKNPLENRFETIV
jgi:L-asparaginase